jgi:uncharacterized protein
MAEYLSPEVYIEELSSGIKPIQGVSTSVAGFIGLAQKGPIGKATEITSFGAFVRTFGTFIDGANLAFAVNAFFLEGGQSCYVVRTCAYAGTVPTAVKATRPFQDAAAANVFSLTASSEGAWGLDVSASITLLGGGAFRLELRYRGNVVEVFDQVTMDRNSPNHLLTRVSAESSTVTAVDLAPSASPPLIPAATAAPVFLAGGTDGGTPQTSDFTGNAAIGSGFFAFDQVDRLNLLAAPDAVDRPVHLKGIAYAELRKDCLYIADSQSSIATADDVVKYKQALGLYASENALNSKYAALYAPWVKVFDPRNGKAIKIPPSGVVAGRYAAVDQSRGVHKAAAGVEDGRALSVLDVDRVFNDAEQAKLNPLGINVIRKLAGVGPVLWGARTTSSDPEWTYLNVRRFFLFVEQSIEAATKWTVFEPNDPTLWKAITLNVASFLRTQWDIGALVGLKEEQAFYVKCDAETNPPESVALGRVITEVGLAVVKPAEFVIVRFSQQAAKP